MFTEEEMKLSDCKTQLHLVLRFAFSSRVKHFFNITDSVKTTAEEAKNAKCISLCGITVINLSKRQTDLLNM